MPTTTRPAPDARGLPLLFVGAALSVVSFVTLRWYSVDSTADTAGSGFTFADLHDNADRLGAPVAAAYFDKLAWGIVAVVVLLGLAAQVPSPLIRVLRVLGFLVGMLGVALTYYALAQLFNAQRAAGASHHGVLHNSDYGLWLAFAGYFLAGVGAVLGAGSGSARASDTIVR